MDDGAMIYLDYNATTPLDAQVLVEMTAAASLWANPSSSYDAGKLAKSALEESRSRVGPC